MSCEDDIFSGARSSPQKKSQIRTNKLLEAGIIVRSQELGRSLSAGRESRFAAEHSPGV